MIGFLIKKIFFDGWDHFLSLAILNSLFLLFCFVAITASQFIQSYPAGIALFIVCLCAAGILTQGVSNITVVLLNGGQLSFIQLWHSITGTWVHGILFIFIEGVLIGITAAALIYYFSLATVIGLFLGMCVLWVFITVQCAFLWFFPVRSQLEPHFIKCIKKCFILFFDNTGFTFFMLLYSILLLLITPVMVFLVPGISGLLFAWNTAFKLRMYKYDWLEQHSSTPPKKSCKHIPWRELLEQERERLGKRTLRNFIFPWKD